MQDALRPRALIAEDEPVLARVLMKLLTQLMPQLDICAVVHDGNEAVEMARRHLPDVIFMDIRMPERNGLEACEQIVDTWPADLPLPLTVFVTAFDRFAIEAFERAAVDYVLKPVEEGRMALTCRRLLDRLSDRQQRSDAQAMAPLMALLNGDLPAVPGAIARSSLQAAPLNFIQANAGTTVHLAAVDDVLFFEADDKYVRVVTKERPLFIRTPLRELLPRLEAGRFTQIHRGIAVRTSLIDRVVREENGRALLYLKDREERLPVSRSYAHLFKGM